jgi:hypothetical protein
MANEDSWRLADSGNDDVRGCSSHFFFLCRQCLSSSDARTKLHPFPSQTRNYIYMNIFRCKQMQDCTASTLKEKPVLSQFPNILFSLICGSLTSSARIAQTVEHYAILNGPGFESLFGQTCFLCESKSKAQKVLVMISLSGGRSSNLSTRIIAFDQL